VKRMKKAIKEYHANGQRVRAQGMTRADNKAGNPTCKMGW
jgi:hypothetical protein